MENTIENKIRETLAEKLLKKPMVENYAPQYGVELDTVTIAIRIPASVVKSLKSNLSVTNTEIWFQTLSELVEKEIIANQESWFMPIDTDVQGLVSVQESIANEKIRIVQLLQELIKQTKDEPSIALMEVQIKSAQDSILACETEILRLKNEALKSAQEKANEKKGNKEYQKALEILKARGIDIPIADEKSEVKPAENLETKLDEFA